VLRQEQEGENVGHHRFKITVEAIIEAPETVPPNQDPTKESLTQTLQNQLLSLPVGGTYEIKANHLKVTKKDKA
jgi:hypothetical protein